MTGNDLGAVLMALWASFSFGVFGIFSRRGMAHVDPQTGSLISIGTVSLVFTLTTPLWMRAEYWFTPGFWVFFANGFMHPTLSMYCSYEATKRTGATVAGTLAATTPLWATLIAIAWLGERPSLLNTIGMLLTVGGVMVLSWVRGPTRRLVLTALLFATGAAVVRAVNHNLGRYGLGLLPVPMMAGWVSFTLGFLLSTGAYRVVKGHFPLRLPQRGLLYCGAAGLCGASAIFGMYSALGLGSVVLVTPIISAAPVFTLLVAWLFREERITTRVATGVLVTVLGVVLVATG